MTASLRSSCLTMGVWRASDIRVSEGTNRGDPLGPSHVLELGDAYRLCPGARLARWTMIEEAPGLMRIAPESDGGAPGKRLVTDSIARFMSRAGELREALILVEQTEAGKPAALYLAPFDRWTREDEYRLIAIDERGGHDGLAQMGCSAFLRGTKISLASGALRRVEDLCPGDRVLTRDDGAQPLRWVGTVTQRADTRHAPIRISAGALHNCDDLIVSPDNRLFLYQRQDVIGAGRAEVMVKARHLVNGSTVRRDTGGFVDYVQLVFDRHQIIFAEGIAVETTLIDSRSGQTLPDDLSFMRDEARPDQAELTEAAIEVNEALLLHPETTERLRMASMR